MVHSATDALCSTWCNPAPTDGSAPNLVIMAKDKMGKSYWKCAYNTQACEQLNSWLGGFESILKHMTVGNFNWFLHTILFYHTKYVIEKQRRKQAKPQKKDQDDDDDDIDDSDLNTVDW